MVTTQMIFIDGSRRGLTAVGSEAFHKVYDALVVKPQRFPVIGFDQAARDLVSTLAELRRRDWSSTARWDRLADETGVFGELAFSKALQVPSWQALENFEAGLSGSDAGVDLVFAGEGVDVKATRGDGLRFKFSRNNPNRHRASIIGFTHVVDQPFKTAVRLMGWAWRHHIRPYERPDGLKRSIVRFETLERGGVVQPVAELLALATSVKTILGEV
jgi:hypothetical protein